MSVYAGNAAALYRVRNGSDKSGGPYVEYVYRGTKDAIQGLVADAALADSYVIDHDGPVWEITIRFGNQEILGQPEVPQREERLHWNLVTKSIYDHPRYKGLTAALIAEVRSSVDARIPLPLPAPPPPADPLMSELYAYVMAGVDSISINQAVVIVTETASTSWVWPITFVNVGSIYSTAGMINNVGLTSAWAGNLPASGPEGSSFTYGWKKAPPEILTTGGNKTQLVRQFEYGLWPNTLFTVLV